MDHPSLFTRDADTWRTTAIVASGFAALELLFILVVGLALLAKPFMGGDERPSSIAAVKKEATATPAPAAKSPPAAQPVVEAKPRNETSVMVLNGNGSSGAASEKADLVQTKGYLVAGTANAPRTDFARSVVMFRPGHRLEAERLSKDFQIGRVSPLDGLRPADLQGAHVVLIVGES